MHVIGKLLTLFDAPEDMLYSCFEKGCPTKPYTTMPKGIMGNGGSWSLIKALGVSQTQRETVQINVFMHSLSLLVNTVNLNQSTSNSFYPQYQSALSRTIFRCCGTTFVETAVYF